jgi:hypothetical protein
VDLVVIPGTNKDPSVVYSKYSLRAGSQRLVDPTERVFLLADRLGTLSY